MADVSYSKNVAARMRGRAATLLSALDALARALARHRDHRGLHCDLGDRLSARLDAEMGLSVALEGGAGVSGADRRTASCSPIRWRASAGRSPACFSPHCVGIPAGLALGASPTARAAFLPLCRLLYPIPGIAWIPLAILWFGVGFTSTVFVIFFSGIWSIMFNTMTGVQTLSGQYTDVAKVYLASRSLYTRRILIPGSLPYIITGMRLTYGVGWRVIVGAEMISSITGLGFLIDDARWQLRPDIMICGMITIAMIGWVSENWFFDWVEEKTLVRWGMRTA